MTSYHKNLSIDLETYSSVNLSKSGVYVYSEAPDFQILLIGYSFDGGPVIVIDVANGEKVPDEFIAALEDESITKWAFNTSFERICLSRFLGYPTGNYINPRGWKDTMIWSNVMGINLSLKGVGAVLKLDEQKMEEGKELIKYFCVPCKPTKANGGRTRNLPYHAPDKYKLFIEYNRRDVEVEMSIQDKFKNYPVPDFIWNEYWESEAINDRGALIDVELATNAISINEKVTSELFEQMKEITNVDNPNSVSQLKDWLTSNGCEVDSLGKKAIKELKKNIEDDLVGSVIELRELTCKSSIKKYEAMTASVSADNRARGLFSFASCKTLRFASKRIQLQNLKRNELPDLKEARELVKTNNLEALELLYDDIPDVLSQLVRTAIIPKKGCKFIVSDFSSIEARVLAYLANEKWRINAFKEGKDIYCESASQMFGVPVEKHGINGDLRQKGKIAELALGYSGGVGALTAMGAIDMGLTEDELPEIVTRWRQASPNITRFWKQCGDAAFKAVREKTTVLLEDKSIAFRYQSGMLFIDLPSGHSIVYVKPRIEINELGKEEITYEGVNMAKKWTRIKVYSGKFVENIVQSYARHILTFAIHNLTQAGYNIVGHIHDECIIECPIDTQMETISEIMGRAPEWAPGLLLRADAYETNFYKKD